MKKPWLSKTVWANIIVALSALHPAVGAVVAAHPEAVMAAMGVLNLVLRMVTKEKLGLE